LAKSAVEAAMAQTVSFFIAVQSSLVADDLWWERREKHKAVWRAELAQLPTTAPKLVEKLLKELMYEVAYDVMCVAVDAALDAYHVHGEHWPISPAGFFPSRLEFFEKHGYFEVHTPSIDCDVEQHSLDIVGNCVAWEAQSKPYWCVGSPMWIDGGHRPHVVHATPVQTERAMLHMVKWGDSRPRVLDEQVSIVVTRQCRACAQCALDRGWPIPIVSSSAFHTAHRRECARIRRELTRLQVEAAAAWAAHR
jgi:hypothetical protein